MTYPWDVHSDKKRTSLSVVARLLLLTVDEFAASARTPGARCLLSTRPQSDLQNNNALQTYILLMRFLSYQNQCRRRVNLNRNVHSGNVVPPELEMPTKLGFRLVV